MSDDKKRKERIIKLYNKLNKLNKDLDGNKIVENKKKFIKENSKSITEIKNEMNEFIKDKNKQDNNYQKNTILKVENTGKKEIKSKDNTLNIKNEILLPAVGYVIIFIFSFGWYKLTGKVVKVGK